MIVLVLVLAVVLRAAVLDHSLAYDEIYSYLSFAKGNFFDTYRQLYNGNNHLLNTFFTHGFVGLLGKSDLTVRLSAFLFGIGSIVACYFFFKRLHNKRAGLLGAFLMAVCAYHIRYCTESRGYTAFLFFALTAAWNLLEAINTKRFLPWVLFSVSLILVVFSNLFAVILLVPFACFIVFFAIVSGKDWDRRFGIGVGIAALVTAAGLYFLYAPAIPIGEYVLSFWKTGKLPPNSFLVFAVEIYPYDWTFLENLFAQLGWGGGWRLWLALGLAAGGVVLAYRQRRWKEATLFLSLLLIPLAIAKASGMVSVYRLFFYCIPFYVYFVVVAVMGIQNAFLKRNARWRESAMPAMAVFALISAQPLAQYLAGEGSRGVDGDWRRGMEFIRPRCQQSDFVSGEPPGEPASHAGIAVQYYWHEDLERGRLSDVLGDEIGSWRLQFYYSPDPAGFGPAVFAAKDLKVFYARPKVSFDRRWSAVGGKSPSLILYRKNGRTEPGQVQWDASAGDAQFVVPRGIRKALLYCDKFQIAKGKPFVLAFQAQGDFRGFVRVDFFSGTTMTFNFDVRRLRSIEEKATEFLFKAFAWRDATEGQVVLEIAGSSWRDQKVRISDFQLYQAK